MTDVTEKIIERYTAESACSDSLSCGNNLEHLSLSAGEWVLDLGCGAGRETLEAARVVGKKGVVVGYDITAEMLKTAEKSALDCQLENTRFVAGSVEDLPFADQTFDAVTSNCVINHALDKTKVYREIYRVLKRDGRFVISDAVSLTPLPDTIKDDPDHWAACFGGAVTEEEYMDSILKAGFKSAEVINRREYEKNGFPFASLTIRTNK